MKYYRKGFIYGFFIHHFFILLSPRSTAYILYSSISCKEYYFAYIQSAFLLVEQAFVCFSYSVININQLSGRPIIKNRIVKEKIRRAALICILAANITLLVIFKYTDFIITTVNQITHGNIALTGIILPAGISFYTFQGMSYIIDIYRNTCACCKKPLDTALYISLFPQLVAGPIVKYNEIYHQINHRHTTISDFSYGIIRFIIGLSKKVLIANVLGETADAIFSSNPSGIDTPTAWIGIICYTFQIYYDFSGYSDMAIGLGKMFGFSFPENFNYPYISKSVTEFWRRWHISLSTWFRDYIYIPLGGSRSGNTSLHILTVFFITGLWHGASWNFVIWGMWYGVFLVLEKPVMKLSFYKKIPSVFKWALTMLIVIIGWVFFKSETLSAAWAYILSMAGIGNASPQTAHFSYIYYLDRRLIFSVICAAVCSIPLWKNRFSELCQSNIWARIVQLVLVFTLFFICIIYITNNVYNPFIYFQF